MIDRKLIRAIFKELSILFVLFGLDLEGVGADVGVKVFTGDAYRLNVLNRFCPVRRPESNSLSCNLYNAMNSLIWPDSHINSLPPFGRWHGTNDCRCHILLFIDTKRSENILIVCILHCL